MEWHACRLCGSSGIVREVPSRDSLPSGPCVPASHSQTLGDVHGMALDLTTPLPETNDGYKHLIVTIDCYSKWCKLGPLHKKDSCTVAEWFLNDILTCYGKCALVHTDKGIKFWGLFHDLLKSYGITHRFTSTAWPCANG